MAFYNSDAEDQLVIPTTGHGASFIEYFLENKFYTFFLMKCCLGYQQKVFI